MMRERVWSRALVTASACCLAVVGCGTTTSEKPAPPFSSPPADCVPVQDAGKTAVSSFAGNLYDPKVEFRSERPEHASAKVLTCYGAYTTDGQHTAGGTDPRVNTVFVTITVTYADTWSGSDAVEDTKRSFTSYRDEHAKSAKIVGGLGDDAYTSKEITDTDASAEVDFRVGNAVLHVRLNRSYLQSPSPQQESDVESNALALARALAGGIDAFM
ncbi:hypothetical protein AB0M22_21370 [Nocardia sp. NPDC051756]|uniref:hypothetical protein n=1 Tax=Nocardia sp. NPDC051756 TaxID=3154751 RepID=UPI0034412792